MGKKIQNYILENSIGSGQFGKVYKAYNERTNAVVAIKVIQVQKFRLSPKLQEFTINEINTLSKMEDTTHIVKFIQILKTANNYYFVYQFCNQGTLQEKIKLQGKFVQEKALSYFKQLLSAFKMLVKNNIMHRDIKPSNILLHNGIIKLADFGFCKPMKDSKDLAQTMLGSPIYMAPEILKGQIYTMKADIWSLGVVLYQMVYGFCPFQQRSIAKLINLIEQGTVNFPSNVKISHKTQQLLKRMLVKDQFKRIQWNQLFLYDFDGQITSNYRSITKNQVISNPFSKKHFNSVSNDMQERKALSPLDYTNRNNQYNKEKDRKRSNTVHDIRQMKHQNYETNHPSNNFPLEMKKIKSTGVCDVQKKMIQNLLQTRQQILKGIKMIQSYLNQSFSKLAVYISCFIFKKIKKLEIEMQEIIKKIKKQWQNKQNNNEFYTAEFHKIFQILSNQRSQIEQKFQPFQDQFKYIVQPQDIIYLRYGEEEGLTQQKEGLIQLLQIDDYLSISKRKQIQKSNYLQNYGGKSKKELLDEYEKRIIRNT